MRRSTWKLRQWWSRQYIRLGVCVLWCLLCLLAERLGAFEGLHDTTLTTITSLERARTSPPPTRVLVVDWASIDPSRRGEDASAIITHLARASRYVIVDLQTLELPSAALWQALPCDPSRILYYAPQRPDALPSTCPFAPIGREALSPDALYDASQSASRHIWSRLEVITGKPLGQARGHLWFGAFSPILSAQVMREEKMQHDALVEDRIVWITRDQGEMLHEVAPGVSASRELARAQELVNLIEERLLVPSSSLLELLTALLLLLFAASISAEPRGLRKLLVTSAALLVVSGLFIAWLDFWLQLAMPLCVAWGGVVILRILPPRISELQVDVRMRLLDVTRSVNAERAHLMTREQHFWDSSLSRAMSLMGGDEILSGMIAELPDGSWWITPRAFFQMTEKEIFERRRDIRREPYETPVLMQRAVLSSRQFLQDESLDVILSPLYHGNRLMGFWMLATSPQAGRATLARYGERIKQVSRQLAREIAWRRIEARQQRKADVQGVDQLVDEALLTLEQISLQKEMIEHVVQGTQVGLLLVSLLGEVLFSNEFILLQAPGRVERAMRGENLEEVLAVFVEDERVDVARAFIDVALRGEVQSWRISGQDGDTLSVLEFTLAPVKDAGRAQVESLLLTSHDVTGLMEAEFERTRLLQTFYTSTTDTVESMERYAQILSQSTSLSRAEQRVVERLTRSTTSLVSQMASISSVLAALDASGDGTTERQIPVSMTYALKRFVRQHQLAAPAFTLDHGEDASELFIVLAQPELLQRAFGLLWSELDAWRAEDASVQVRCQRQARVILLEWVLTASALPGSVLQSIARMQEQEGVGAGLSEPTDAESSESPRDDAPALQLAGASLRRMGATLDVSFSDREELTLRVVFPSHES